MAVRSVTVRLEGDDYGRLESEARRLGMRPGTLARVLLRAGLASPDTRIDARRRAATAALDRLAAMRGTLPPGEPADAVRIVADAREERAGGSPPEA